MFFYSIELFTFLNLRIDLVVDGLHLCMKLYGTHGIQLSFCLKKGTLRLIHI